MKEITSRPTVSGAIQGMWVGNESQLEELLFSRCSDEADALKAFILRNPIVLIDILERKMLGEIMNYMMKYVKSHQEPLCLWNEVRALC